MQWIGMVDGTLIVSHQLRFGSNVLWLTIALDRSSRYPPPSRLAHPKDCSVMTYRGHSVLRTLIRCHFSPRESTGQGYIYSGSADGLIHIWSLDGRGELSDLTPP